ncbi:MAG: hypothetical protein P4L50_12025 [Anaerolineaceae bacterium]|nr:hypothetical protein [Anaerolineaceae bacterium]
MEIGIKSKPILCIFLSLAAVLGVAALLFSTHWGPGIGGDATIYITSARNVLAGKGIGLIQPDGSFRLIPYFPPFFPLLLSLIGLTGADLVETAHWLNMLLFGGLVWLGGYLTFRASRSALLAGILAALLMASPILIPVYSWAMAEPLSIFCGVLGLVWLVEYLHQPSRATLLILAGLLAGLSFLTRYSAVAYLAAGWVGLLLFGAKRMRQKLVESLLYLAPGLLPMAVWAVYDISKTSTLASRSLETGPGMANRIASMLPPLKNIILRWLVPDSWISTPHYPASFNLLLDILFVLGLLLWLGLILWKLNRTADKTPNKDLFQLLVLLALFILAYLGLIFVVYISTYPPITLDDRMFSPVHIAILWIIVLLAGLTLNLWPGWRWLKLGLPVLLILFAAAYGWRTMRIVVQNYDLGLGYTSPDWRGSPTIKALKALPPGSTIVTNETMAVLFLTGRTAYPYAEIYLNKPLSVFSEYGNGDLSSDSGQQRLFRENKAVLVLFDSLPSQLGSIYGDQTAQRIQKLTNGLQISFKGSDGGIYDYPAQ